MADIQERTDDRDTETWLRLIRIPGLGAQGLRALLERHATPAAVWQAVADEPGAFGLSSTALRIDESLIEADLRWLDTSAHHHLLTWADPGYPVLLRDSPRPPMALFVHGDPGVLWQPQIAIVGSRNPTADGRDNAHAFAATLARQGFAITSGLAGGIDSAAHEGAMAAGGLTIAVVGTGVDVVYPASNRPLAETIAQTGALVSEFPPGTPPRAAHFPQRNRILAGLALGTLVVEAALRSGSLITARMAGEAGRELFALPGSIHNPMARGCHRLIREGAKLVETAAEIVEELRPLALGLGETLRRTLAQDSSSPDADAANDTNAIARLADPDYHRLWAALGSDPVPIDALVMRTGLTAPAISSMLLLMELDGMITVGTNGRYGRAVRKAG